MRYSKRSVECGQPFSYQGYDYETVYVAGSCWFAENLRAFRFRNGVEIATDLTSEEWSTTNQPAANAFGHGDGIYIQQCLFGFCRRVQSLQNIFVMGSSTICIR